MPYRAMFSTIVTACVALLGLGMWLWYVAPLVAATAAIEATSAPAHGVVESQAHLMKSLVQGVLLLSFLLICLLLIVGFAATFREWARYGSRRGVRGGGGSKTAYVDAWKIAGERLKVDESEDV